MKAASFLIFALSLLVTTQSFAQKGRAAEQRTAKLGSETPNEEIKETSSFDRFHTSCELYHRSSRLKDEVRMEHRERDLLNMMQEEIGTNKRVEASAESEETTESEEESSRLTTQRALLEEFEVLHKKYDRASLHRKREILDDFRTTMEQDVKKESRKLRKED